MFQPVSRPVMRAAEAVRRAAVVCLPRCRAAQTVAGWIGDRPAGTVHRPRRSSVVGLVAGLLALTWGTTGLAQAGLFTMAQVWNLPGPARPGYLQRLGRAALFLAVLGLGVIVTTLLTSLGA